MSRFYGYGEDFLTLLVLIKRIDEFLSELEDKISSECYIYYRPSFGRAGGTEEKKSSQFGEFDAIVVNGGNAYLIESKWDGSSFEDNTLKLTDNQVHRHMVMEWYHENWSYNIWDDDKKASEFESKFHKNVFPSERSKLRNNLDTIMNQIQNKQIKHVILYITKSGKIPIKEKYFLNDDEIKFEKVIIDYTQEPSNGNFILL